MKHEFYSEAQQEELALASFARKEVYYTYLPKETNGTKNPNVDLHKFSTTPFTGHGTTKFYNAAYFTKDVAKIRFNQYVYGI